MLHYIHIIKHGTDVTLTEEPFKTETADRYQRTVEIFPSLHRRIFKLKR